MKPRAALVQTGAAVVAFGFGLFDRDAQTPTEMHIVIVVPARIFATEAKGNVGIGAKLMHGVAGVALAKSGRGGPGGCGKRKSGCGEYK